MAIVRHCTIEVPITLTAVDETKLGWAQQHIQHQIKELLKQKKWTREPGYGIEDIRQVGPIEFVPRRP